MLSSNLAQLANQSYSTVQKVDYEKLIADNKYYMGLHLIKWGVLVFSAAHNMVSVWLHGLTMPLEALAEAAAIMEFFARAVLILAGMLGIVTIETFIWAAGTLFITAMAAGEQATITRNWLTIAITLAFLGVLGFFNPDFGHWYFKWVFPFTSFIMYAASLHLLYNDPQLFAFRQDQQYKRESGLAVVKAQHNQLMLSVEMTNDQTAMMREAYRKRSWRAWWAMRLDWSGHKAGGKTLYSGAMEQLDEVKPVLKLLEHDTTTRSRRRGKATPELEKADTEEIGHNNGRLKKGSRLWPPKNWLGL